MYSRRLYAQKTLWRKCSREREALYSGNVAYNLYNNVAHTRWSVPRTQFTVYSIIFAYLPAACTSCTQYTVLVLILMFGWRIFGTDVYHLRGLGCSIVGGCVTEAKSHRCIEERTSDVVISAFFRWTGGCSEHVDALRFSFQHTNRHTSNPPFQNFSTSYNSAVITSSSGRFFMLSV